MNWIVMDREDGFVAEFETQGEAVEWAQKVVDDYDGTDGYPDELLEGSVFVAHVTHRSGPVNKRPAETGSSFDFLCEVEMLPADLKAHQRKTDGPSGHGPGLCPKVPHEGGEYDHAEDYEGLYTAEVFTYCGRCHRGIDTTDKEG